MSHFRFSLLVCVAILCNAAFAAETPTSPMPKSLLSKAEQSDSEVREQFQREAGHAPSTGRELLQWLDQKSLRATNLDDAQKDALVQSYGAVLGQVLLREFGGRWVVVPGQGNSPGIDLPGGKVAFVFNRAARRIFDGDAIGFVAFYESTASYVRGSSLPPNAEAKSER